MKKVMILKSFSMYVVGQEVMLKAANADLLAAKGLVEVVDHYPDPDPEPEVPAVPDPVAEIQPELEPDPDPVAEIQPELEPDPDPVPDPVAEIQPELEPDPDPVPDQPKVKIKK